jgi:hypothetical protein
MALLGTLIPLYVNVYRPTNTYLEVHALCRTDGLLAPEDTVRKIYGLGIFWSWVFTALCSGYEEAMAVLKKETWKKDAGTGMGMDAGVGAVLVAAYAAFAGLDVFADSLGWPLAGQKGGKNRVAAGKVVHHAFTLLVYLWFVRGLVLLMDAGYAMSEKRNLETTETESLTFGRRCWMYLGHLPGCARQTWPSERRVWLWASLTAFLLPAYFISSPNFIENLLIMNVAFSFKMVYLALHPSDKSFGGRVTLWAVSGSMVIMMGVLWMVPSWVGKFEGFESCEEREVISALNSGHVGLPLSGHGWWEREQVGVMLGVVGWAVWFVYMGPEAKADRKEKYEIKRYVGSGQGGQRNRSVIEEEMDEDQLWKNTTARVLELFGKKAR